MKSDVLDELYAVAPEDFVATRTALATSARAAGDRQSASAIAALRKPTVAAWAINALVHERPLALEPFRDFAPRLRRAQSTLDARVMRELRGERDEVLGSVITSVEFVAERHERPLTPASIDEVRTTLVAALADEAAQAAVLSGHLVRPLTYAGFGEVDLDDAVASEVLSAARANIIENDELPAARGVDDVPPVAPAAGGADGDPPDRAKEPSTPEPSTPESSALKPPVTRALDAPAIGPVLGSAPDPAKRETARAPRRANDRARAKRARSEAVRAEMIACERQRLEHALLDLDHALARVSLQRAEQIRLAEKSTRRADELEGLLIRARQEAEEAQAAARQVDNDRQETQVKLNQLRRKLDALDSRA